MEILIHDYAGHPFEVQLSRSLARRGHHVIHAYCGSLETTPQAGLTVLDDDPACLELRCVELAEPIDKYSFIKRRRQEAEYGRRVAGLVAESPVAVVISANAPLDAQWHVLRACRRKGIRFVYWVQDLLGIGTHRILRGKWPLLGELVGRYYIRLEKSLLKQSDAIVLITEDFRPIVESWDVDRARIHVIPNWAPLAEIPLQPKHNDWALQNGLADKFCFLYSGTLGLKHDPELLLRLASGFGSHRDVRVVLVSQGLGADYLRAQKERLGLDNMVIMGFQPYRQLPQVLATADVLVALLAPDAGVFSVPSKVLSYLCAGRCLLLAVPSENLAARIVEQSRAGAVVAPQDPEGFLSAAQALWKDGARRADFGSNARRYAEAHFDIEDITDQFEEIFLTPSEGAQE